MHTLFTSPLHKIGRYPKVARVFRAIGRRLFVAGLNANNYDMAANGEAWLIQKLAPHLDSCLDVGANKGNWAAEILKAAPEAKVYCIEAIPEFAAEIRERFGNRVRVLQIALTNSEGKITLYKQGGGSKAAPLNTNKSVEIRTMDSTTGDRLVQSSCIQKVSLIKIDVDGHDMPVIEGFAETIRSERPVVQFEYSRFWIAMRYFLRDAFTFFEGHRYVVARIMPDRIDSREYSTADETFFTNNFVAIPKEKLSYFED